MIVHVNAVRQPLKVYSTIRFKKWLTKNWHIDGREREIDNDTTSNLQNCAAEQYQQLHQDLQEVPTSDQNNNIYYTYIHANVHFTNWQHFTSDVIKSFEEESSLEPFTPLPWVLLALPFFLVCFPAWQWSQSNGNWSSSKYITETVPVDGWLGQYHFHHQIQSSLHSLCLLLQVCLHVPCSQDPKVADRWWRK